MTVCVAAISHGDRVIGVSDRMLSTTEIAFEPSTRKFRSLTSAIFAMTAGDAAVQAEILAHVQQDVDRLISAPNAEWLSVGHVAELYLAHWNRVKRSRAENAFLTPLGLTSERFLGGHSLGPEVVDRLVNAIVNYALPRVEAIIGGVDSRGPHIWVIEDGNLRCEDAVGFACIGSGRRHAESQMMMGQHHPFSDLPRTLVVSHLAKKRAEVSPSVGGATDMLISGPALGQSIFLGEDPIRQLDADFKKLVAGENKALARAHDAFQRYLNGLVSPVAVPQQSTAEPTASGQ